MSSPNRGRRLVVVLTLVTTIVAAVVAGLSVDAGTRADAANRESQYLVLVASNQTTTDLTAEGYQASLVTDVFSADGDALAHEYAALKIAQSGDAAGASEASALGKAYRASATAARALSDIYQTPEWAPTTPDGFPNVQAYYDAHNAVTSEIVARQNVATDTYAEWSAKGDTYVAILSVLAVTFFLLGLAQVSKRMRPFLAICAAGLMVISIGWTAAVFA